MLLRWSVKFKLIIWLTLLIETTLKRFSLFIFFTRAWKVLLRFVFAIGCGFPTVTCDFKAPKVKIEDIWRWVYRAQYAIQTEVISAIGLWKPTGKYNLKNIATHAMLYAFFDQVYKCFITHIRRCFPFFFTFWHFLCSITQDFLIFIICPSREFVVCYQNED